MKKHIKTIPLKLIDKKFDLNYQENRISTLALNLESFCNELDYMNHPDFFNHTIFPYEVKAINLIEDYKQDISNIASIIDHSDIDTGIDLTEYRRIKNIIDGYRYIMQGRSINEKNLKNLYTILSNELLESTEKLEPGSTYRQKDVYIHYSRNLEVPPDKGIDASLIKEHMENLFDYINSGPEKSPIETFIKSQIAHFFFVYIHPYYDLNGRTSRSLALWHLQNNESYPYTIFNRAISKRKNEYFTVIREVKKYNNLTFFLKYMLECTQAELEKEYIIKNILEVKEQSVNPQERMLIEFAIDRGTPFTVLDYTSIYNKTNPKKRPYDLSDNSIKPLINKGIFTKGKDTSSLMSTNEPNYFVSLNNECLKYDKQKVRHINSIKTV
jgi:Fic family protein